MTTRTTDTLRPLEVFGLRPGDNGYKRFRGMFAQVTNQPPITGIVLSLPDDITLGEREYLIVRYCLEQTLAGQVCALTGYKSMNVDLMFDDKTLTGMQQIHILAHLVLAFAHELIGTQEVHDCLTVLKEQQTVILWFSAGFMADDLRRLVSELHTDLKTLLGGSIEGRIARRVFS